MAKAQRQGVIKTNYFGFNITLRSNERNGTLAYTELINALANISFVRIFSDKAMTLRNKFVTKGVIDGIENDFIYGNLVKFTLLEGDHWYNSQNKDVENFNPPVNVYPNAFETDYVFIPAAHRFFIKISSKISVKSTQLFLTEGLKQASSTTEQVNVTVIQSHDVIDRIINSEGLQSLQVVVSYTNDDLGDEAQQVIDDLLKDSNTGEAELNLKPDQTGALKTDSKLVRGFLELAKENGNATARIIKQDGTKEKIVTSNHPEKIAVESANEDESKRALFNQTMNEYRNGNRNNESTNNESR